jgi:proteasome lid subunit RPN8/RPN11
MASCKRRKCKISIYVENVTSSEILKEKAIIIYSKPIVPGEDPTLKYIPLVIGGAIGVVAFAAVAVFLRRKKSDEEIHAERREVAQVQTNTQSETQAISFPVTQTEQIQVPQYAPQSQIQEEKHYDEYHPVPTQHSFSQPQPQTQVGFSQTTQTTNIEPEVPNIETEGIAAKIEALSEEKFKVREQVSMDTTPKIEERKTEEKAEMVSVQQPDVVDNAISKENVVNEVSVASENVSSEKKESTNEHATVTEEQPAEQKSVKAAAEQLLAALWEIDEVQAEKDEYVQMTMDRLGSEQVQPAERKIAIRALPSVSEDFATIPIPIEYIDTAIDGIPEEHLGYIHEKVDVYLTESVVEKIVAHCILYADRKLECMGFMLGDRFKWGQKEYSVVKDVVTTDLDTTAVSVRFKREGFAKLFAQLEKLDYDYIIVGWYHSHPGYSCFLSDTDIETQRRMFKNPHQAAVVCDPVRMELKAFKMVDDQNYTEVSYAIIKEFR